MNVSELIDWLKTVEQTAKVEIPVTDVNYSNCGELYSSTYHEEFDPLGYGHFSFCKKTNTLTLGS